MLAGDAVEELSCMGKSAVDFLKGVPWVGTIFTIYNVAQDIREGTPIGYVDAALDIAIGILLTFWVLSLSQLHLFSWQTE